MADEVAHTSLKTPTACAAALVEQVQTFLTQADTAWAGIARRGALLAAAADSQLATIALQLRHQVVSAVERGDDRLAQRAHRVRVGAQRTVERADARLTIAEAAVRRTPRLLDADARHMDSVEQRVRLLDPALTMARGWSITRTADGRTVRTAADLQPGDEIVTTFASGTARSRVEETAP